MPQVVFGIMPGLGGRERCVQRDDVDTNDDDNGRGR